jgi:hypothetical protein
VFLDCCTRPLFEESGTIVYRILSPGESGQPAGGWPNLMANPGFEEGMTGWSALGSPSVGDNPSRAATGKAAVLVTADSQLVHRVPVRSGAFYSLSHANRADEHDQSARLQIDWLDDRGELISESTAVVPAAADWKRRSMTVESPAGAATAAVYATADPSSRVWLDDFTFSAR